MENKNRFEIGILKVVAIIGLVRYVIAFVVNDPSVDGNINYYLDIITACVFLVGLILVYRKADSKRIVWLFFIPLIILLWIGLYVNKGLISAGEINAFAIVIIVSLTVQGRLTWVLVGTLLIGMISLLYFVEQQNLASLNPSMYDTGTTSLLLVTLANIGITFHAKNTFNYSRVRLKLTNKNLRNRRDEIEQKKEELTKQNEHLIELRANLEEKVLKRTEKLMEQKESIEQYLQLTLTELMKPYQKTVASIKNLENSSKDEMIDMLKASGSKLEIEIENLKSRLTDASK